MATKREFYGILISARTRLKLPLTFCNTTNKEAQSHKNNINKT